MTSYVQGFFCSLWINTEFTLLLWISWTHRGGQRDVVHVQVSVSRRPGDQQPANGVRQAGARPQMKVPDCTGDWRGQSGFSRAGLKMFKIKVRRSPHLSAPRWTAPSGTARWTSTPRSYKDARGSERSAGDVAPRCPTWPEGKPECRWRAEWPEDKQSEEQD